MPTPNGVNYLLQFLQFLQFPNYRNTRIKSGRSSYVLISSLCYHTQWCFKRVKHFFQGQRYKNNLILSIFLLKNRIKSCSCWEIRAEYWEIRWAYREADQVGRSSLPLATKGTRERSSFRSAKTGGELTDRGWRGTFSSALRLLLDDYLMFHHAKVSIPPILFRNAFVERETRMGGIQKISPKSLPYPSHDLSYS